jgi:hypothetical protein
MGIRRKFFAATYDSFIRKTERAGLAEMRRSLLADASGQVLEVGAAPEPILPTTGQPSPL